MKADAIIFDMDGTLWDATASYAAVWNAALKQIGLDNEVTSQQLVPLMGQTLEAILATLLGDSLPKRGEFLQRLSHCEAQMMPQLGGKLYPGVKATLERLAATHRLMMLSNCSSSGLKNFTAFTGTAHCFSALLTQGERPVSKAENLRYLVARHGLEKPVYVGDTQADCNEAHSAGVSFVHAAYGFGSCSNPDAVIRRFDELPELIESVTAPEP